MAPRKITAEIEAKMRALRAEYGLSYHVLSLRFGIPESTIEKRLSRSEKNIEYVSPDCR